MHLPWQKVAKLDSLSKEAEYLWGGLEHHRGPLLKLSHMRTNCLREAAKKSGPIAAKCLSFTRDISKAFLFYFFNNREWVRCENFVALTFSFVLIGLHSLLLFLESSSCHFLSGCVMFALLSLHCGIL